MSVAVITLIAVNLFTPITASAATDEAKRIGVDVAHAEGLDGSGRTVAVISGGVDTNHPTFDGAIVAEACFSQAGTCPDDGDGDPTDAHGPGAAHCRFEFDTACEHGTFAASVLAGRGGGGTRAGVAPQADVVAIRIDHDNSSLADLTTALEHLADVDELSAIDAVVMGGGQVTYAAACDSVDPDLTAAIATLRSQDVGLVAEAGFVFLEPDARVIPGCVSGVTAVLAGDGGDYSPWLPYTQFGSRLAAPSYEVSGAAAGGSMTTMNGSSHQPFVAGAMALLRQQDPSRSVASMEQRLFDTGAHIAGPTHPLLRRIDVGAALGLRSPQAQAVWVITSTGAVHPRGDAPNLGGASGLTPGEVVVAGAPTRTGGGYWLATNFGRVVPRGDAMHHGDMFGKHLNSPIVAMAATNAGDGYWLLGRDGGIFTFGGADFYGSTGG
jgi:serine protease